jgi:LmbE family N-acetylglucosaminyl deacetylase
MDEMEERFKKVLVLSPHTDDLEIGCGGTVSRFLREGAKVYSLVFSCVNPSVNPPGILADECKTASNILGLTGIEIQSYTMRRLNFYRQDILEHLVSVREKINPDLVLIPSHNDLHQDHATISQEGTRAFKLVTTLGYELPWNNLKFTSTAFIKLSHEDVEKKVCAAKAYQSQSEKIYMQPDFIRALAKTRGCQVGAMLAEAYEVIRWVR